MLIVDTPHGPCVFVAIVVMVLGYKVDTPHSPDGVGAYHRATATAMLMEASKKAKTLPTQDGAAAEEEPKGHFASHQCCRTLKFLHPATPLLAIFHIFLTRFAPFLAKNGQKRAELGEKEGKNLQPLGVSRFGAP